MQSSAFLIDVLEFIIIIFSLCVHECAHAWTASRLGDQTARMEGRITLNPMAHADPIGTLLFPAIMIFGPLVGLNMLSGILVGWAKPTPVMTRNFRKIVRDDNLVSLAGPASNLLLTLTAVVVLIVYSKLIPDGRAVVLESFFATLDPSAGMIPQPLVLLCTLAILINLSLFVFNLLPIPPLDGSRVVRNLLPYNAVQVYDRIPMWASYLFMILLGGTVIRAFVSPAIGLIIRALMHA